jgi:hypothetical protein
MDHLNLPASSTTDDLKAPCLIYGDYVCKQLELVLYAERCSYNAQDIICGHARNSRSLHFAAFVQKWLYFGLLNEMLAFPAPSRLFVHQNAHGESWITSDALQIYITKWLYAQAQRSMREEQSNCSKMKDLLEKESRVLIGIDKVASSDSILGQILITIIVLKETPCVSMRSTAVISWRCCQQCGLCRFYTPWWCGR